MRRTHSFSDWSHNDTRTTSTVLIHKVDVEYNVHGHLTLVKCVHCALCYFCSHQKVAGFKVQCVCNNFFILEKITTETFRESTYQGNWKPLQNSNFQIFLPDQVEHVEQDCAAHNDQTAMQLHHPWKTKKLQKTGLYY